MGVNQKPDGQVKVGLGYSDLNEYKGYAGRREIVIQLTSDGATQDSLDALEFLKSYALYHNSVGEPIFPASTNVFISNSGVTKAVEADEVTVDGDNVNIGGCVWNGENWDFTNAGQGGGGGGGGEKFIVTLTPTAPDYSGAMDKTVAEINAAYEDGMEIWFRIMISSNTYVETPLTYCLHDGLDYPAFGTQAIEFNNDVLIVARIISTDDGTEKTYATKVYSLTPAS